MRPAVDDPDRPWDELGVYRVARDTYRLPLPMPGDGLKAVNSYVVVREAGLTLIDPGIGAEASREALERGLAALDAGPGDVRDVLVTHVHYDHYEQAIALRRRQGTPVWLGRHEAPSLEVRREPGAPQRNRGQRLHRYGSARLSRLAAERQPDPVTAERMREDPDHWIDDGQLVDEGTLRAIHTPGHTSGHVVFRDEARSMLYAGDHVLPSITPSIAFEPVNPRLPLADYLASLHTIRALPDTRLLPAHGSVTPSVHERIDALVDHHAARLAAAADAVGQGASTGLEVARRLRWTRHERTFEELDPFNQILAVLETGFHLDLLAERGAVTVSLEDGVANFAIG